MAKPPPSPDENPAPEAPPEAARAPEPAIGAARQRRVAPWLVAAVAALAVGLLIWARLSGPVPGTEAEDPAAAALEQRFAVIEQRFAAIETGLDAAADARRDADENAAARLDALDGRIADIEARSPTAAEPVDLGPLEDRLTALEEAVDATREAAANAGGAASDLEERIAALETLSAEADADLSPAAILLAVAQLRTALRGSGPYEAALTALEAVGGGDDGVAAALAALTPRATVGIPTPEKLRDRFATLAEDILRAAVAPPEGSWIRRTLARLSGLVTVRRVGGDVAGDTADAIVARAEARLASDDLAAAVGEVEMLDGVPAEIAASWLADARARIAADAALATLDARAIAAMGGS